MRSIPGYFSILAAFLLLAPVARAVVLDWDPLSWTPGSLNNSYDIDPAKPGNDVTVTISGATVRLIPDSVAPMAPTPSLATSLTGGLPGPPQKNLLFHLNLVDQTESISISLSFSANYTLGVQDVSFTLFDVDFGAAAFQDQLRSIRALSTDGVTLIAPTITTGPSASVTGAGINQIVNGNTPSGAATGDGNVTISFGSNAIRSFSLLYGSGSNAPVDPGTQKVGLHDISFTPVPEVNPAWIALTSCLLTGALAFRQRSKSAKRQA